VNGSVPAAAVAVVVVVAPTGGVVVVVPAGGGVVVVPTGGGVVVVPTGGGVVPQSAGTLYDWHVELLANAALAPIIASTPTSPTNAAIRFIESLRPFVRRGSPILA
jgi:hypothetical protein